MFGLAPADARRQGRVPAARLLPRLTDAHLVCLQRQNGLIPQIVSLPEQACPRADLLPAPGGTARQAVPLAWPDVIHPYINGSLPAGEYAQFTLVEPPDDLPLALDWILHTWLFYAPYDLRLPDVLLQGEGALRVLVPVLRRPT